MTDREQNTTQFVYRTDRQHYLDEVIDPLGRTGAKSLYDENGRLSRIVDAGGSEIALEYDPENFVQTVTDQRGNETVLEYDTLGNIKTEISPDGLVTRRAFDDGANNTQPTSITQVLEDGTELVTHFEYDDRGNEVLMIDPAGNETRRTYNRFGEVTSETDGSGRTTTHGYDRAGNRTSTTNADGVVTTYAYDRSGNLTQFTVGGVSTTVSYDGSGNPTRIVNAAGSVETLTYDGNGNALTHTTEFTTSAGTSTVLKEFERDSEGRTTRSSTRQDGVLLASVSSEYDAFGNITSITNGEGHTTRIEYDANGNEVARLFPDGTPADDADNPRITYEYDTGGNVTSRTDEDGYVTRFEYDAVGRLRKTIYPAITAADPNDLDPSDNPFIETIYDRLGRPVVEIDELGNRIRGVYDSASNLTETILPDQTPETEDDNPRLTYQYDAIGQRIATIDELGRTTRNLFSPGGQLIETILPDDTPDDDSDNPRATNQFDTDGLLLRTTDTGGNAKSYEYDDLRRLSAVVEFVTDPATGMLSEQRTAFEYDELGNLVAQTDARGHVTRFEYDGVAAADCRRAAARPTVDNVVRPRGQRCKHD